MAQGARVAEGYNAEVGAGAGARAKASAKAGAGPEVVCWLATCSHLPPVCVSLWGSPRRLIARTSQTISRRSNQQADLKVATTQL